MGLECRWSGAGGSAKSTQIALSDKRARPHQRAHKGSQTLHLKETFHKIAHTFGVETGVTWLAEPEVWRPWRAPCFWSRKKWSLALHISCTFRMTGILNNAYNCFTRTRGSNEYFNMQRNCYFSKWFCQTNTFVSSDAATFCAKKWHILTHTPQIQIYIHLNPTDKNEKDGPSGKQPGRGNGRWGE